jgi:phosphoribosyl 1,2-cyclic phosphodiesterase
MMLVKFWGVHGSLPRPGPSTLKYGGNTPCVEVRCGKNLIIFDAGSGIRELGEDMVRRRRVGEIHETNITGHIFFSHLHWDHVQGFPFFAPAFQNSNEFHLYAGRGLNSTIHRIMRDQMDQPNFPITLKDMGAALFFHDLNSGDTVTIDEVVVRAERVNHPGGCFGYRVESGEKIMIYASDTEIVEEIDPRVVEFARNADLLIHDGMFTPEQYLGIGDDISRESWGHSTWEGAVRTAVAAAAKHLVLFHHGNDDATVQEIERKARERFPKTTAAYEGLEIEIY